jgi:hypothetical protein
MHRIICSRLNIFRKYFMKNNNIRQNRNENEILFTNINEILKNDYQNIHEKLEFIDNKMKVLDEKIELVLKCVLHIENDARKSEEIVLINN